MIGLNIATGRSDRRPHKLKTLALLTLLAVAAPFAKADFATFTGSQGNLAAQAKFDFDSNILKITLTNTASVKSTVPSSLLSGIFFNLTGVSPTLTPSSAILPTGSNIVQANQCSTGNCVGATNVGGEFAYNTGIAGRPFYGIAANGYINVNAGNFNGADLDSPNAPNGLNFGLVTSNFNAGDGNGGMDGDPFIKSSVVFTLFGVSGLTASKVSNVVFQYGTSLSDPNFVGTGPNPPQGQIPEPSSVLLLGSMIVGMCHLVYKRRSA
jgi:hypothetical protein